MLFKSDNREPRFMFVKTEGSLNKDQGRCRILVDRETGVHYLWVESGQAGGLTPLLDKDGKPIGTKN